MDAMAPMGGRKFWSNGEGYFGMAVLAAAVLGGGYFVAPFIIVALANTIHAAILGGVCLGGIGLALNTSFRTACSAAFQVVMRKIYGAIVTIDLIGVMENHLKTMRKADIKTDESIEALDGKIIKQERKVSEDTRTIQNDIAIASKAKEKGKRFDMVLHARNAERLKESTVNLQEMLNRMKSLRATLGKISEVTKFMIQDTENTIKVKRDEYEAIKACHSAIQSAKSVLQGNPDEMAMWEMANEALANEVGQKLGEINRFIEMSASAIDKMDIEKEIFEDKGMKLLEDWEQNGSLDVLNYQKPVDLTVSPETKVEQPASRPVKKYTKLIGNRADYLEVKGGN